WVYPATDAKRFKAYLDRLERGNAFGFFVARTEDDSMVGVININDVVLGGFRSGSLGYYGAAAFCGKGYMTSGCRRCSTTPSRSLSSTASKPTCSPVTPPRSRSS